MANTLQDTLNFSLPYGRYQSATVGMTNQPALSIASKVRNIILSAPLTWRFNRGKTTTIITTGLQDFTATITDLQFLEKCSLVPSATITNVVANGSLATITAANSFVKGNSVTISGLTHTALNVTAVITAANSTSFQFATSQTISTAADSGLALSGDVFEIPNVMNAETLAETSTLGRPQSICVFANGDADAHTLRFMPCPEQQYQVYLTYQKRPVQFTATTDTWSPIPDSYSDIYDNLFLGYYLDSCQDPRGTSFRAIGGAALLAKAEGLAETDKATFMAAYLHLDAMQIISQLSAQQGVQARGQK